MPNLRYSTFLSKFRVFCQNLEFWVKLANNSDDINIRIDAKDMYRAQRKFCRLI